MIKQIDIRVFLGEKMTQEFSGASVENGILHWPSQREIEKKAKAIGILASAIPAKIFGVNLNGGQR